MNIDKILVSYNIDSRLSVIFYHEKTCLLYNLYSFREETTDKINCIEEYKCIKTFEEKVYIKDIKENEDLDNYFILLSNTDIIRINITDIQGSIIQVVTTHKSNEDYYKNLFKWYLESKLIVEIN